MTQIAQRAITTVSAQRATFTRANVHAEISRGLAAVRCHTPEDRDQLLDTVTDLALDSTVRLTPHRYQSPDQHHPGLSSGTDHAFNDTAAYATPEQLDAEARLIDAATNNQGPVISDTTRAEAVLDSITVGDGHSLADDQRRAALSIATAPQSVSALIGPAGTGKTTSLSALRQVWEDQHGTGSIVGLAPSAVAASVLSKEIDIPTDNVTKWLWESAGPGAQHRQEQLDKARDEMTLLLAHLDDSPSAAQQRTMRRLNATITQLETTQDRYTMRPNQLVIVDEASMAGTQALDQLRDQAQHAGAKIVAVGDPAQLSAIEAGGTLGWIERHQDRPDVTAATLSSVWRFKNDWEASNSLALREGQHHAIDTLIEHDRITGVADPDDVETTAFQQWAEARTQGSALLIASTKDSVDRLNAQAQALLRSEGEVDGTHTAELSAGTVAGVGDRILTRRNERAVLDDHGEFIKNGDLLTVTRVHADGALEAARDNGAAVHLSPEVLATTQLGYACTAHRSQGATVDRAITAVDPSTTSRETFYVGMTRGRYSNTAVLPIPDSDGQDTQTDTPDPWKMIREITPKTVRDQLVRVLDRSDTDMTAHEVRDHAHGWDADLPRLTDELRYAGQAIATRQAVEWVERSHGPETVTSWANSEHWHAIINEIARGHRVPEEPAPETPREALAAVKAADLQPRSTRHGGLAVPTSDNDAETHTVRQVLDKISDRLTVLRAQTHNEPWRSSLATEPTQRIDAALIARQACDWDDPDTVLPDTPPQDRRAAEAWQNFHDSATQPDQTTTPEPTPFPDDQRHVHPESPEVIDTTTGPEGAHL
ncbi:MULTISPECIES: ATP-dependent DNA helicase [Kocuria]|nr:MULTISPECIES: AAA family ATPase [Kocuria]MCG7425964.1 AAA family ATPase [Kocuria rhizophila]MCT2172670.1 AAA family ATPase [Kocuria rhizophila]MCT2249281.1 AAA family ATPase [Kocuria rhizophila]MDA4828640.1 AAA family ATPase [Kocuria rhizophila]MDN3463249.1 AAA family ATPase [Kocuria sp. APC 4018]